MAKSYKTPGVYIEEIPKFPPSVADVPTAIPAFVGYTEFASSTSDRNSNDLLNVPKRITSILEFERFFGKDPNVFVDKKTAQISNKNFVTYDSVRLFYDNGGGVCYIVSVGNYENNTFKPEIFKQGLKELEKIDEVTLLAIPDAATTLDASKLGTVQQEMLAQCRKLQDRFAILDVKTSADSQNDFKEFRDNIGVNAIDYGAAYYPYIYTTYSIDFTFDDVIIKLNDKYNLIENFDSFFSHLNNNDKSIVKKVVLSVLENPKTPPKDSPDSEDPNIKEVKQFEKQAIIQLIPYYKETLEKLVQESSLVPPSGAIAGIYAQNDNYVGVWKAPANMSLAAVRGVSCLIDNQSQEEMNISTTGKSINAIRPFSGKGILVWGARTIHGNDNEWRYIPVRRLFIYVEESVKKSTEWAVFSPNTQNTWMKIKCQIENFLINLWRAGGLAGATPQEAFYVNVGLGTTMDSQDILEGRLIVEIGMAASRPAEFVILRFSHKLQES